MSQLNVKDLSGRQKAAIVMLTLGPEASSEIFKHFGEEEIEQITLEIASIRQVDPRTRQGVLEEFYDLLAAQEFVTTGGVDHARQLLEKALGSHKASDVIARMTASLQVRPFDFARKTDPAQLLNFIQHEHPQTIALILAYLHAEQAAIILSALPAEMQVEVAQRLATLDRTAPDVLEEVEATLERRVAAFVTQNYTSAGGIDVAVDVLNRVDRATEKTIMDSLEENDPELAEEIRKRMFVFEDIVLLSDRDIQNIVREVDSSVWVLALKTASEEVLERIYKNMSKRAAEILQEEIEYLGPVRLKDVEEAQQKVVSVIRQLEKAGELVVVRSGEEEMVV